MTNDTEILTFSIDSRLLEELGENLVTRNHVAVAELIKNAYDADATEVDLKFINARQRKDQTSEIHISDNGTGMTPTEIRDNWMRIATTDKIRNPKSEKYGRTKTGDKGIGRFACRRLANSLRLVSCAHDQDAGGYVETKVEFKWSDFAREEDLDSIPVEAQVERTEKSRNTGVRLELYNLKDKWTQQDFDTLRRNVITLSVVEPQRRGPEYDEDPGFDISFEAPEFEYGEGTLLEQFHEAGWGRLQGRISEEGVIELDLEAKLIGHRDYRLSKNVQGLEGTTFKISYVPRTKEHFRDTKTLSLKRAREIMDEHGGIRVYKDGFRVYPYGGPEDDWLGIDRYATRRIGRPDETFDELTGSLEFHREYEKTMHVHPRNENLMGRVSINSDADLTMTAAREGFKESELFEELKDALRLSLQWLTLHYSNYQAKKKEKELEEEAEKLKKSLENDNEPSESERSEAGSIGGSSVSQSSPIDNAISVLETASKNTTDSNQGESSTVSSDAVDTATRVLKRSVERQEQEIDFLRSAFSVNQLIFGFSHELRSMINQLDSNAKEIENAVGDLPNQYQEKFSGIATDLRGMRERFQEQLSLFGIFMESPGDLEEKPIRIRKVTERSLGGAAHIIEHYSIEYVLDIPELLATPEMYETELYSIIINLLTNSIKAIIASDGGDQIRIEASDIEGGVKIRVFDDGIGVSEGQWEQSFEPLVSDPGNELYDNLRESLPSNLRDELGSGTGLGLSIVRDIAEHHGGTAEFVDPGDWATCVEVCLYE